MKAVLFFFDCHFNNEVIMNELDKMIFRYRLNRLVNESECQSLEQAVEVVYNGSLRTSTILRDYLKELRHYNSTAALELSCFEPIKTYYLINRHVKESDLVKIPILS